MKLVLLITDYGSFNNFLSELSLELITHHIDLHIICSSNKVINVVDKISFADKKISFHFIDIPRKVSFLSQLRSAYRIRKVIDRIKPDLIHSHFTTGTFPTILFKNTNYKYWGTFHGLGMNASSGFKKVVFNFVERLCFSRLDRIFVVNEKDHDLVKTIQPDKVQKYSSFGFGCDLNKFDPSTLTKGPRVDLRKQYDIQSEFVVAFTGRYVAFKGFHIVIKAMIELERQHAGCFKFIIMGGRDPIHPTGLSKEEEAVMNELPMLVNIGQTPIVEQFLAISDVFLFPSTKEGLPTCVLEALSMGLPVVTMNSRGNSDIVKDQYNGLLVPVQEGIDEVDYIVRCLWSLYSERETLKLMSVNALADRNSYSRSIFIDEQLKLYNTL